MDVDVDPLESQAYRRSKETAEKPASRTPQIPSSSSPTPPPSDGKKKAPIRRRRSNRVSKSLAQPSSSQPSTTRRRSSASGDTMDFTTGYEAGELHQESLSGSPQQSLRGPEAALEMPVRYTPVTNRVSRAKKGVPVHTCDLCRPPKVCARMVGSVMLGD